MMAIKIYVLLIRRLYFWQNYADGSNDPAASIFRVEKKPSS